MTVKKLCNLFCKPNITSLLLIKSRNMLAMQSIQMLSMTHCVLWWISLNMCC